MTSSLADTTPDSKYVGFCTRDMNYMVKGFDNRFIVNVHMRYRCGNIVFDTSIYDNKSM